MKPSPRGPRLASTLPSLPSLLLVLAVGCASSGPPAPESPVPVPAVWSSAEEQAPASEPGSEWWRSFGDRRLEALVAEALEHNRDLRAAAARVEAAAARARIAGADLAPQVGLGFDASRRKQNFIGLPIPGAEGGVLSSTSTNLGVSLNVSWEADLWGRLRSGREAARGDLAAAREDLLAARQSLAAQTLKAWFGVLEAERQVELAAATLESRRRTAERVRRRYEAGVRGALDLRLALTAEAQAAFALEQRRQRLDGVRRQLEVLLGRYPAGELADRSGDPGLPAVLGAVPAGLPAEVLTRRPDLRAAERRLEASGARVAQARAALYPQLRLTGSAGTASNELKDLLDGDFSVWNLAGGLLQPLFQGGRLRAGVELAEAGREEALALYAQRVLAAFAEVETALAAEGYLAAQEEALEAAVEQSTAAERTAEQRYLSGLVGYLTVLESQREALAARGQLLAVRRQRLATRVDLHLALGGDLTSAAATPTKLESEEG